MQAPTKAETKLLEPFKKLSLDQIVLPSTEEEFKRATNEILSAQVVGFDTESKPTFAKSEKSAGPHVVQFSLKNKAFIFQVSQSNCKNISLKYFNLKTF